MLIVFGFEVEGVKLLEQVVIVAFGGFGVDAEDGFHRVKEYGCYEKFWWKYVDG